MASAKTLSRSVYASLKNDVARILSRARSVATGALAVALAPHPASHRASPALYRYIEKGDRLRPGTAHRDIGQRNKWLPPCRAAEAVVAAAVSRYGNGSQTSSLTRRCFGSLAGVYPISSVSSWRSRSQAGGP